MSEETATLARDQEADATRGARRKQSPREAAAVLIRVNETLRDRIALMEELVEGLRRDLKEREDSAEQMEQEIRLAIMHLAGMEAELEAFRSDHQYSSLLKSSGESFPDGSPKTRARVIYEEAFDREGRTQGLEDPESHR